MCLASVVKKFELWRPRFGETPILVIPNFDQILSFFYTYLSQTLHGSSLKVKNFEFRKAPFGETPRFWDPIFC